MLPSPLKFPVISFWKPTHKNLVGRELSINICQSWNFKEVVKNPNNSKSGWKEALGCGFEQTATHTLSELTPELLLENQAAVGIAGTSQFTFLLQEQQEVFLPANPQLHIEE